MKHPYEHSTIKDQQSNYGIPLNYGVRINIQKKSFIEPAESCPHLLKITLWKKLGRLVQKYRIAI